MVRKDWVWSGCSH